MADSKKIAVAKIERFGEKLILPEKMDEDQAIQVLMTEKTRKNTLARFMYDYDYFPWDGAFAFSKVCEKRYGYVFGKTERSFFGDNPPSLVGVEIGPGITTQVAWGQFVLPALGNAQVQTTNGVKSGRMFFRLVVTAKQGFKEEIEALHEDMKSYLRENSIYRGKAISIRFLDDDGEPLLENGEVPTPHFIDLSRDRYHELVLTRQVSNEVETYLFTPIERMQEVRNLRMANSRGVLLAGPFGTGKTLIAYVAACKAVTNGVTYVQCDNPREFVDTMRFASQYAGDSGAVVFCEDVDRIIPSGERTFDIDKLINNIDGVDTKNRSIITVFTTNEVDKINKALLRPGRMDAVIHVDLPDAEAAEQLVRNYAGQYLPKDADLSQVGELLAGKIPAVIEEVCKRAKLAALRHTPIGKPVDEIPVEALLESAQTMKRQLDLLYGTDEKPKSDLLQAAETVSGSFHRIASAMESHLPPATPAKAEAKKWALRQNHELAD